MQTIESFLNQVVAVAWGKPLIFLLVGGGLFFLYHSRFLAYRHLGNAVAITLGKYNDDSDANGDTSHFQALMLALSGTLGRG